MRQVRLCPLVILTWLPPLSYFPPLCSKEYVLKAEFDELNAKYKQLLLRFRESSGNVSESYLLDGSPSGLIQRHLAVGESPSVSPLEFRIGGPFDTNVSNVPSACRQQLYGCPWQQCHWNWQRCGGTLPFVYNQVCIIHYYHLSE